jgi:hypothetical protein
MEVGTPAVCEALGKSAEKVVGGKDEL